MVKVESFESRVKTTTIRAMIAAQALSLLISDVLEAQSNDHQDKDNDLPQAASKNYHNSDFAPQ